MTLTEEDYMFLPVAEVDRPPKGSFFQCYRNYWWKVCPERGLVFYNPLNTQTGRRLRSWLGSPLCNIDEQISRITIAPVPFPVEVRQFEAVFVPIEISDFRQD